MVLLWTALFIWVLYLLCGSNGDVVANFKKTISTVGTALKIGFIVARIITDMIIERVGFLRRARQWWLSVPEPEFEKELGKPFHGPHRPAFEDPDDDL
jgi:hypothetical protein